MHESLLGLLVAVVVVGAQVARADDLDGPRFGHHRAESAQRNGRGRGCGPRPEYAPRGQQQAQGRYELQAVQQWVPGAQQEVWVPGQCYGERHHRNRYQQRCTEGSYQVVSTAGHYETTQQWVWVASGYVPQQQYAQPQYQDPYQPQYSGAGFQVQSDDGQFSLSVY